MVDASSEHSEQWPRGLKSGGTYRMGPGRSGGQTPFPDPLPGATAVGTRAVSRGGVLCAGPTVTCLLLASGDPRAKGFVFPHSPSKWGCWGEYKRWFLFGWC